MDDAEPEWLQTRIETPVPISGHSPPAIHLAIWPSLGEPDTAAEVNWPLVMHGADGTHLWTRWPRPSRPGFGLGPIVTATRCR